MNHTILPFALIAAAGAVSLQPPPQASASHQRAIETARATLRGMVASGKAPGVAGAVAVRGAIVWAEGFGFADVEARIPATADTRFGLGSISKVLTMAAAVRLADRGVLDLDAPIERYLKDFPHPGRGITIRRLAAHQSGLSDAFASAHYQTTRHFDTVESAYAAIIQNIALTFEPGTKVEYATGLYTIIARAMEISAGASYLEILDREVLRPLDLASIVPNDPRAPVPHRTRFYMATAPGGFEPGPPFDPSHKLAGAGLLGSAEDIARFGAGLLDPRFLSDRARAALFTPVRLLDGTPGNYAAGLSAGTHAARPMIHLPGGGIGISTWIFIHPEDELVIAILANLPTAPVGGATHRTIANAFLGK